MLKDYRNKVSSNEAIIEDPTQVAHLMAEELHTLGGDPHQTVPEEFWSEVLPYTNKLSPRQHGFRAGHQCADHILHVMSTALCIFLR